MTTTDAGVTDASVWYPAPMAGAAARSEARPATDVVVSANVVVWSLRNRLLAR